MFLRYPSRQREVPLRLIVPSLLTTLGLCSGLVSLHFSLKADYDRAVAAIMVAAIFDMLDGRAARFLHASSKFGAVLDSLSDFLCFGVAPALLLHQWMLTQPDMQPVKRPIESLVLVAVLLFALCSALRLARFTAAADTPHPPRDARASALAGKFFTGMPTPAAAAAVLIPVMLQMSKFLGAAPPTLAIVAYTIVLAWLMVSRQPMFSFKKLRIPRPLVVPLLLVVGIWVVLAAKDFWLAIAIIAGVYLLMLPLSIVSYTRTSRQFDTAVPPSSATAPGDQPGAPIPVAPAGATGPAPASPEI